MHGRESTIRQAHKAASRFAAKDNDDHFDLRVAMNGRNDWFDLE